MSSSQANASARRRRAAPPLSNSTIPSRVDVPNRQQPSLNPNVGPVALPIPGSVQNSGPRQPLTPAQMLIAHERRLAELENAMLDSNRRMQEGIASLGVSQDDAEGAPWDSHIRELSERINAIDAAMRDETMEDAPEDVEFFRKKVADLEKQFISLKRMVVRVQTFAMETNLTLMKYKNGMDSKLAARINSVHEGYDDRMVNDTHAFQDDEDHSESGEQLDDSNVGFSAWGDEAHLEIVADKEFLKSANDGLAEE